MEWTTCVLEDGTQHHRTDTETHILDVYDWPSGHVDWYVYDISKQEFLVTGDSDSADEAKIAAEQSIKEGA